MGEKWRSTWEDDTPMPVDLRVYVLVRMDVSFKTTRQLNIRLEIS